jgi:nitroreductase
MDAIECIKTRRSVRHFNNEPVRDEDLKTILECAKLAPSGHNRQPWEFFITKSKEKIERLSEVCTYGKFLKNAYYCIVVTGDDSITEHVVEDCSAATENILLAAHALGYGGCWIAGWNRIYERDVFEIMRIEDKRLKLISLVALGVPQDTTPGLKKVRDGCIHLVD